MNYTRERIKIAEISLQRRHLKAKILPLIIHSKVNRAKCDLKFSHFKGRVGFVSE